MKLVAKILSIGLIVCLLSFLLVSCSEEDHVRIAGSYGVLTEGDPAKEIRLASDLTELELPVPTPADYPYLTFTPNSSNLTVSVRGADSTVTLVEIPEKIKIDDVVYSVSSVEANAFKQYTRLTSIIVPNTVSYLGNSAFEGCSALNFLSIPFIGEKPNTATNSFIGYLFGAAKYIYNKSKVPASLKELVITGNYANIYENAVYQCTSLLKVKISGNVNYLYARVFSNCSNITEVILPSTLTSIGASCFSSCTKLVSLELPLGLKYLESSAFRYCSNLPSITIPNTVISLGTEYTFANCKLLTTITIPAGSGQLSSGFLRDCVALTTINYTGTKAQWNSLAKGPNWNYNTGKYTIYCSDGNISK